MSTLRIALPAKAVEQTHRHLTSKPLVLSFSFPSPLLSPSSPGWPLNLQWSYPPEQLGTIGLAHQSQAHLFGFLVCFCSVLVVVGLQRQGLSIQFRLTWKLLYMTRLTLNSNFSPSLPCARVTDVDYQAKLRGFFCFSRGKHKESLASKASCVESFIKLDIQARCGSARLYKPSTWETEVGDLCEIGSAQSTE